jgi:hypothetical protein
MKTLAKSLIMFSTTLLLSAPVCLTSCSSAESEAIAPQTNVSVAPQAGTLATIPQGIDTSLVNAARRLTNALNAGNEAQARQAFTDNAIFDSVGRIYTGSQDIMNRFLIPEVIRAGGRYTETNIRAGTQANTVRIDYDFRTASYSERFFYEYTIRNGLITSVLGRYL